MRVHRVALAFALLPFVAATADAVPLKRARQFVATDWTSAGISGLTGGDATITLTGVTGTVSKALLYWHGIATGVSSDLYENPEITFNGNPVTGTSLGDSSDNCWGDGTGRAYVAEVTPFVTGDGSYALSGMASQPNYAVNGASLVVMFDDGNHSNDHDLIFFEGNDSNEPSVGMFYEDGGWHATLDGIPFGHGTVHVQLHLADGQSFADDKLDFSTQTKILSIPDTPNLYDGNSVPGMGPGRAPDGLLWDINTLDITGLFERPGTYDVYMNGMTKVADCVSLVLLVVDIGSASGTPICGDGKVTPPEQCDDGNTVDGDCCSSTCQFEPVGQSCGTSTDPCLEARCDGAGTCDAEGRSCRVPVAPRASRLRIRRGGGDHLDWKWATGNSKPGDFGDTSAMPAYDLCVYDKGTGSLRLLSRASIPAGQTWRSTPAGYEYANPAGPVQDIVLRGGVPGTAKITARAGGSFAGPEMPVAPPVLVRLRARDGLCWGANFTQADHNGRRRFVARSDVFNP